MIYFYSTEQTPANSRYHRGILFEDLLRRYLGAAAYEVEISRRKNASAEYDIEGRHRVDGRSVIGEAKAHTDTVGLADVAAFVGKALPYLAKQEPYSAVFLSVSALSPEAEDYLRNLAATTQYKINPLCGAKLESHVREALRLPSREAVSRISAELVPAESSQHLLHTDRGSFVLILGSSERSAFDDRFAVVDGQGTPVRDWELLKQLRQGIQALQELEPVSGEATEQQKDIPRRSVPYGLITAGDWLDYRKPAGEQFFVGRDQQLQRAREIVEESTGGVILEVKARSGVGKSSLLAIVESTWRRSNISVELHDARDVQSADDVLRLFQRFVRDAGKVASFEDVPAALEKLTASGGAGVPLFIVDQFESTFQAPEVFAAYEFVAMCMARSTRPCAMIYSRKDDLLTTHDELVVKLDRLRGLAVSITLEDFSLEEASSLIRRIADTNPSKLSPRVLAQVLEFAQGFPWLLKRTMAHIVATLAKGTSQQELLSSGLHLEDLFDEEVAELDEHERGYLTRIAAVLPATYQTIARRFEDDPFLRGMLEKLTYRKLLRFSSGTYDTYNDVFKDFLLYERLPERGHSQIIRMGVVPLMQAFRALGGRSTIDPDELAREWDKPLTGIYNILRDLRLAGLVAKQSSGWVVPQVVRQYEHQGRLGEYVRQSALRNRVVSDLLAKAERSGVGIGKRDIVDWMRQHFRFVNAKDEVWVTYANTLLDWMVRLRLAERRDDETLVAIAPDQRDSVEELGNLTLAGRGSRPREAFFVPSCPYSTAKRVLANVNGGGVLRSNLSRAEMAAAQDLRRFGAVEIGEDGTLAARMSVRDFDAQVREMLRTEPYVSFFDLLKTGTRWASAVEMAFGLGALAEPTRHTMGKKLANWGRTYGHVPARLTFLNAPSEQLTLS
jgi:hypothetical protein